MDAAIVEDWPARYIDYLASIPHGISEEGYFAETSRKQEVLFLVAICRHMTWTQRSQEQVGQDDVRNDTNTTPILSTRI
jgi:hypothetical protein